MAFKGMNPEEGREVAQGVSEAGQQINDVVSAVTNVVNSVEWVGPDYEAFREEWNSFVSGPVAGLVNGLSEKGQLLTQHAEEQDTTSNQN